MWVHDFRYDRARDIGFVFSSISYPDLVSVPIYRELMYLVSRRDSGYEDGISCSELDRSNETYLAWGPDYRLWHESHFSPAKPPLITVNTGSMLQRYLDVPGRWGIAPMSVIQGAMRSNPELIYCQLKDPPSPRICYMLTSRVPNVILGEALENFKSEITGFIESDPDICSFEKWMLRNN